MEVFPFIRCSSSLQLFSRHQLKIDWLLFRQESTPGSYRTPFPPKLPHVTKIPVDPAQPISLFRIQHLCTLINLLLSILHLLGRSMLIDSNTLSRSTTELFRRGKRLINYFPHSYFRLNEEIVALSMRMNGMEVDSIRASKIFKNEQQNKKRTSCALAYF